MNLADCIVEIANDIRDWLLIKTKLSGGTTGQSLKKLSDSNFDFGWGSSGGGGSTIALNAANAIYFVGGVPQNGPHSANVNEIILPANYLAQFSPLDDTVTIFAPIPEESVGSGFGNTTINRSTFGNFHPINDGLGNTTVVTVDCDFSVGIVPRVMKTIVNQHDGPMNIVILNAFGGVVSKNLTDDGLGNPMVKMEPVKGSTVRLMFDDNSFSAFVYGDTVAP